MNASGAAAKGATAATEGTPSVEQVASVVAGLTANSPLDRGRILDRIIDEHDVRDVLVLGFERGVAPCYAAAALARRGAGRVVAIGPSSRLALSPSITDLLDELSVRERATVFFEYSGYNWRMYHLLAQRPRPQFDLVFLNGRHSWDADGFAFLLAEQLLAPGGIVIFAALRWSIANSPTMTEAAKHIPADQRDSQQVKLVVDELVKSHPNIVEYWEDLSWGFARKHDRSLTLDDEQRRTARDLMERQAETVRQRAQNALDDGDVQALVAPLPLTGKRPPLGRPQ
jgi:predicted O-methyltransferase YrrM